jgi:hypothetical protein
MISIRTKTLKKPYDASGNVYDISGAYIPLQTESLMTFLENNSLNAYKRPWHRLESGLRLNRLRLYTNDVCEKHNLNADEKNELFTLLRKSLLERKILNSKSIVDYDMDEQKILEIKGLTVNKQDGEKTTFQIVEKKSSATRKKREATL